MFKENMLIKAFEKDPENYIRIIAKYLIDHPEMEERLRKEVEKAK